MLDHSEARSRFPGLEGPDVLLDNAGGSQVPRAVADRVHDYLLHSYVQLGADYATSKRAVATVDAAREFARRVVNAGDRGDVVFAPSTSVACAMLADCHARALVPGRDEVVVCDAGHEANIGPWVRLADRGHRVRHWVPDADGSLRIGDLDALLSERTRLVAMHHVSNLLGRIEDIRTVADRAHAVGARLCLDGVAFAPHRSVDVQALGADFYVFSTYKVYGPHMAVLFGTHEAFAELVGPNHFFVPEHEVPYRFELGGPNHESCAAWLGVADYLAEVAGVAANGLDRAAIERAFDRFRAWEQRPMERLVGWLSARADVRIFGPATADPDVRVPTVSFVHARRKSRSIAQALNAKGLGVRYGHFYAHRLTTALGLVPDDGVVRTSLVHYNTENEVDRLIEAMAEELDRS